MVDINAYKTLHPGTRHSTTMLHDDFGPQKMARDQPPDGDALLVFEPSITAYNLQEKTWRTLLVDRVTEIVWNKQAFEDLVVDPKTKELVQAVVMKQLNTTQSTDFVTGKGNGLIMLLHGAPGTGKTFTAEGVAEFAEKPLLRVTCGDVGTKAETVDRRLRGTFKLGKMWDCGMALLNTSTVPLLIQIQLCFWTRQTFSSRKGM
jgi:Cdc6-like AAA superfamily ATPase